MDHTIALKHCAHELLSKHYALRLDSMATGPDDHLPHGNKALTKRSIMQALQDIICITIMG